MRILLSRISPVALVAIAFTLTPTAWAQYTETILHAFSSSGDGTSATGNLILDASGSLCGTTFYGGANNWGTVYQISPGSGGSDSILYSFTGKADGLSPGAGLVLDAAGNLYGTNGLAANVELHSPYALMAGSPFSANTRLKPRTARVWMLTPSVKASRWSRSHSPRGNRTVVWTSGRMVGPERFERPTPSFVAKCSIQLSYGPLWETIYTTTKAPKEWCGRPQQSPANQSGVLPTHRQSRSPQVRLRDLCESLASLAVKI
jgi:uncharacterized repeat protein (TIGR03803 family)